MSNEHLRPAEKHGIQVYLLSLLLLFFGVVIVTDIVRGFAGALRNFCP